MFIRTLINQLAVNKSKVLPKMHHKQQFRQLLKIKKLPDPLNNNQASDTVMVTSDLPNLNDKMQELSALQNQLKEMQFFSLFSKKNFHGNHITEPNVIAFEKDINNIR